MCGPCSHTILTAPGVTFRRSWRVPPSSRQPLGGTANEKSSRYCHCGVRPRGCRIRRRIANRDEERQHQGTGFAPKTVTIAGGDTVQWKNIDTVDHQVVANSGAFASPDRLAPNATYSRRIDTPGTYPYHDALHPDAEGHGKVTGAPPSVSIAASIPIAVYGTRSTSAGRSLRPRSVTRSPSTPSLWGQMSFVKLNDVQTTTNGVLGSRRLAADPHLVQGDMEREDECRRSTVAVSPKADADAHRQLVRGSRPGREARSRGRWVYVQRLNRFGEWVTAEEGHAQPPGSPALQDRRTCRAGVIVSAPS